MADYSYVMVDFWFDNELAAELFAWKHIKRAGRMTVPHFEGGEVEIQVVLPTAGKGFEVEFEQARYGFDGDEEIVSLCRWLSANSIPWKAYDGGGYEWPSAVYRWDPGDPHYYARELDNVGTRLLTQTQWQQAVEASDGDTDRLHQLIEDHFGDDHHGWIQAWPGIDPTRHVRSA